MELVNRGLEKLHNNIEKDHLIIIIISMMDNQSIVFFLTIFCRVFGDWGGGSITNRLVVNECQLTMEI